VKVETKPVRQNVEVRPKDGEKMTSRRGVRRVREQKEQKQQRAHAKEDKSGSAVGNGPGEGGS
jgi:hypothetical protein